MALRMLHMESLMSNNQSRNRPTDLEMQNTSGLPIDSNIEGGSTSNQPLAPLSTAGTGPAPPLTAGGGGTGQQDDPAPPATSRRGRWTRNGISERIGAFRSSESQDNFTRAFNRLQLIHHMRDLEVATATAGGPAATNTRAAASSLSTSALIAGRKDAKSRREREEASTLVGPSLAHYFGSGSSSSGTVGGTSSAAATNPTAAPTSSVNHVEPTSTLAETPGFGGRAIARLGSRGRARGASLSGLNSLGQLAEASDSQPSLQQEAQSTHLEVPPGHLDSVAEAVAMAEGIDIEVLKQWIEKSLDSLGAVQIDGTGEEAVEKALSTPSHCTTLQSYVNLKRNTIRLMTASSSEQGAMSTTASGYGTSVSVAVEDSLLQQSRHPLGDSSVEEGEVFASARSMPMIEESSMRPARSLSMMPDYGSSPWGSSSTPGPSTHQIHFEYDCSSPAASVQVYLRASRKHGSWQTWVEKQAARAGLGTAENDEQGQEAEASKSMFRQRGPAPHVLGWPIHSSVVKNGFAQPVKASLSLDLALYAPPVAPTSESVGNTVAWTSADAGLARSAPLTADQEAASSKKSEVVPPEEETKEQKAAREKSERQTLKLSIVIEALNESGRPYAEPNLQTTYMRLTSLPTRLDPTILGVEETQQVKRTWTAHVEGQEAEIGPHRFQLQELYGLSSRPPPVVPVSQAAAEGADGDIVLPGAASGPGGELGPEGLGTAGDDTFALDMNQFAGGGEGSTGSECLICLSAPINTLLLPCTHGLCLDCSVQLKDSVKAQRDAERKRGKVPKKKYNCPMCRRAFTGMLHLRMAEEIVEDKDQVKTSEPEGVTDATGKTQAHTIVEELT